MSVLTRAFALLAAVALAASACSGEGSGWTRPAAPGPSRRSCSPSPPPAGPGRCPALDRGGPATLRRSLRIQVTNHWLDHEFASDKATIADLQAGKVQLAKGNARAYDTVGVNSFQALLAPFLIDSSTLEQRVPESDLAGECSWGSAGLAWLGWRCCPPTCATAGPVASAGGGQGLPGTGIGIREGEVAKATFTASAPPRRYRPGGPLLRLDGAELDLSGINWNEYDLQAKASPPRCQPIDDRR